MAYLDETGLARLWGKITSKFATKDEVSFKEIYVGSAILAPEITLGDNVRHDLACAFDDQLIAMIFSNIDTPPGHKRAFRLSATITTNNGGKLEIGFNGVTLISHSTYSNEDFRRPVLSNKFYSVEEFPTETISIYGGTGLNLYAKLNSPSTSGAAFGIMIHGYFEKIS